MTGFDLSAALEDAEGKALVQNIITRKASSLKVMIDGEWKDAGVGSVTLTPEEDLFWDQATLQTARKASVEMTVQDVSHDVMALLMGYESAAEMRQAAENRRQLAETARSWAVKWGRGHGKRAALEKIRGRAVITDWLAGVRGEEYPWAESITWTCRKPTEL